MAFIQFQRAKSIWWEIFIIYVCSPLRCHGSDRMLNKSGYEVSGNMAICSPFTSNAMENYLALGNNSQLVMHSELSSIFNIGDYCHTERMHRMIYIFSVWWTPKQVFRSENLFWGSPNREDINHSMHPFSMTVVTNISSSKTLHSYKPHTEGESTDQIAQMCRLILELLAVQDMCQSPYMNMSVFLDAIKLNHMYWGFTSIFI